MLHTSFVLRLNTVGELSITDVGSLIYLFNRMYGVLDGWQAPHEALEFQGTIRHESCSVGAFSLEGERARR